MHSFAYYSKRSQKKIMFPELQYNILYIYFLNEDQQHHIFSTSSKLTIGSPHKRLDSFISETFFSWLCFLKSISVAKWIRPNVIIVILATKTKGQVLLFVTEAVLIVCAKLQTQSTIHKLRLKTSAGSEETQGEKRRMKNIYMLVSDNKFKGFFYFYGICFTL